MKRIFTLLLLLTSTIYAGSAQNLKIILQSGNGAYWNDSTYLVFGSSSSTIIVSPTFDVINKGASAYLHAKRTIISALPTTTNAICFAGLCGSPTDYIAPDSCDIASGDTAELYNAFYGDYYPNSQNGTTTIRYTFYNYSNTDSGSFIIKYITTPTGIAQLSSGQIGFSAPYPNPASSTVNFNYSLTNGIDIANLKIFNMLGACVQTLPLNASKNKASINVQSLPSGVYICEIEANGSRPAYQKMIVSH